MSQARPEQQPEALVERIVELEMRLSYQDAAVETLSAELVRQQRQIDELQLAVRRLAERLPAAGEGAARGSLADEVPPHY